jgi:hypothetical protein
MAELPEEWVYYIYARESYGDGEQVGVTILSGENQLRGLESWTKTVS